MKIYVDAVYPFSIKSDQRLNGGFWMQFPITIQKTTKGKIRKPAGFYARIYSQSYMLFLVNCEPYKDKI
jgi:hypothetical protein